MELLSAWNGVCLDRHSPSPQYNRRASGFPLLPCAELAGWRTLHLPLGREKCPCVAEKGVRCQFWVCASAEHPVWLRWLLCAAATGWGGENSSVWLKLSPPGPRSEETEPALPSLTIILFYYKRAHIKKSSWLCFLFTKTFPVFDLWITSKACKHLKGVKELVLLQGLSIHSFQPIFNISWQELYNCSLWSL